jgi:hypothetical protein
VVFVILKLTLFLHFVAVPFFDQTMSNGSGMSKSQSLTHTDLNTDESKLFCIFTSFVIYSLPWNREMPVRHGNWNILYHDDIWTIL